MQKKGYKHFKKNISSRKKQPFYFIEIWRYDLWLWLILSTEIIYQDSRAKNERIYKHLISEKNSDNRMDILEESGCKFI